MPTSLLFGKAFFSEGGWRWRRRRPQDKTSSPLSSRLAAVTRPPSLENERCHSLGEGQVTTSSCSSSSSASASSPSISASASSSTRLHPLRSVQKDAATSTSPHSELPKTTGSHGNRDRRRRSSSNDRDNKSTGADAAIDASQTIATPGYATLATSTPANKIASATRTSTKNTNQHKNESSKRKKDKRPMPFGPWKPGNRIPEYAGAPSAYDKSLAPFQRRFAAEQNEAFERVCDLLIVVPALKIIAPPEGCSCVVCACSFKAGEFMTELPCGHRFHHRCLTYWFFSTSKQYGKAYFRRRWIPGRRPTKFEIGTARIMTKLYMKMRRPPPLALTCPICRDGISMESIGEKALSLREKYRVHAIQPNEDMDDFDPWLAHRRRRSDSSSSSSSSSLCSLPRCSQPSPLSMESVPTPLFSSSSSVPSMACCHSCDIHDHAKDNATTWRDEDEQFINPSSSSSTSIMGLSNERGSTARTAPGMPNEDEDHEDEDKEAWEVSSDIAIAPDDYRTGVSAERVAQLEKAKTSRRMSTERRLRPHRQQHSEEWVL